MALTHDPPHIKLYDWPNVPQRAKELADEYDIDDILCVAVMPPDMAGSESELELTWSEEINDGDEIYCFIH